MTSTELPIALDAMGGDHAPTEMVRGAALAVRELGVTVTLVGQRDRIDRELAALGPADQAARQRIDIVDASQVVEMDEHPAQAVRAKKDASVVVACDLVASGRAAAAVSAGNSGAVLAAALFTLKRIRGVARPCIGTALPTSTGLCYMVDVGANADCRPEWLAQFAVMGNVYARTMLGIASPRVALLSNGEEEGKGSELVRAAIPLLRAAPVNFIGNVEGKDIFRGAADVVVTDGFTGNVALKMAEGVAEFLFSSISAEARRSLQGKLGGALLKPKLRPIRDRVDYRKTGGALLLGVPGEVVIAHGRSDAEAVLHAIRVARDGAQHSVHTTIAAELGNLATSEAGDAEESATATQHTFAR
jgi:glycerol-3-phosphate acyltransferase PlsX